MSDEQWIIVRNWDKFQHYKDRSPAWVKLHLELAHNESWRRLTLAERGLLCSIWIEYAASRGVIPRTKLASILQGYARDRQVESLCEAGFIELVAIKPLALARSRDVKRREEKKYGDAASSRSQEPRRQNAGAYQQHHTEEPADTVPIETIEAYLMGLQTPHFTDVADD